MVGPAGGPLAAAAASQAAPGGGGGGGGSAVEHLLALKVMRLTRPTLATPLVVTADPRTDLLRDSLNAELRCEATALRGAEELCLGQTLVLPQSFGNIYLGETFTSYVSLHNDSTDACRKVSLRCDLQTATQRIPLYPSSSGASQAADSFPPGGSVDVVLNHEVKELGAHILVCEVHYAAPHRDKLNFRKFFKFQVMKPLDVKTKFYNAESDEVFLEAQVQNVTLGPLCLEKVSLEPSQLFDVASLNETAADGGDSDLDSDDGNSSSDKKKKTVSVFGRVNCIQPQDSRQYLFCLTPRPDVRANHKLLKSVTSIGKLDIVWRTNLGDRGRLQTSQLQRMAPSHGEVRFAVESAPSIALLNRAFTIKGRIINNW